MQILDSGQILVRGFNGELSHVDSESMLGILIVIKVHAKKGVALFPIIKLNQKLLDALLNLGKQTSIEIQVSLADSRQPNHVVLINPLDGDYGKIIDYLNSQAYR